MSEENYIGGGTERAIEVRANTDSGGYIRGSGGWRRKTFGPHNEEDANTLFSTAKAKVIDLISEGEISGLINGKKSVFLDNTPLENSAGVDNFTGTVYSTRVGTNTQDYIPGYEGVETSTNVSVIVTNAGSPGSHTVTLSLIHISEPTRPLYS